MMRNCSPFVGGTCKTVAGIVLTALASCTTDRVLVMTEGLQMAHPKAMVSYTVSAEEPADVLSSGVCYGTSPQPDLATGTCTTADRGPGTFTDTLFNLGNNVDYYVRAYSNSTSGTVYGNELSFRSTLSRPGQGVVVDGYLYPTIILSNGQEWMAENLRTSVYSNGDPIYDFGLTGTTGWVSATFGGFVVYGSDSQNESVYGKLYNWYAVTDDRNLCPTGWHAPSMNDWDSLLSAIAMVPEGYPYYNAGGKMKSTGMQYWQQPNTGATNESLFSAIPGGVRSGSTGEFLYLGQSCYFWSTDAFNLAVASGISLYYASSDASPSNNTKQTGLSVRCLRD